MALGGLHVTSLPDEAAAARRHDLPRARRGHLAAVPRRLPARHARSASIARTSRTLAGLPPIRRDLIKRQLYLVPNSIVVSRGCPHVCDFCYKEAFFEGGRSFYTQTVDAALAEIERLPGRHLYFLDDHLFGDRRFATALFDGMRGMGRLWQAAGTVNAVLAPGPARAGGRRRAAQPVRRLRDAQPGESASSSASTRTCAATTAPRSAVCTTSA